MALIVLLIFLPTVAAFTVTVIVFYLLLVCKRKSTSLPFSQIQAQSGTSSGDSTDLNSVLVTSDAASYDSSIEKVSMRELTAAMENLKRELITSDSLGVVYKVELPKGAVALKKLHPCAFQGVGVREFRAKMETLSKLKHPNIVKILGYRVSGMDRVLIYEFIGNGSLDQLLFEENEKKNLYWELRVRIIKGVANGLAFLHGRDTPIVHRDIKASNVLLDKKFEAHIADFGLAQRVQGNHSRVSTATAETMGYMPPEYLAGSKAATVKADVYSFGVLMYEVATGRRANWLVAEEDGVEMWMLGWAKKKISQNKHIEVIDPLIPRKGLKASEVRDFLMVSELCMSEVPSERPSMEQVVQQLNCLAL